MSQMGFEVSHDGKSLLRGVFGPVTGKSLKPEVN